MQFQKKFFRLRRRVGYRDRQSGHYWVHWSYARDSRGDVWRVGFYDARFETWFLPGDTREYKDGDFIEISNRQVDNWPYSIIAKLMLVVTMACCIGSIVFSILTVIRHSK